MKKLIPIFALLLVSISQVSVFAASGSLEIEVPKEAGDIMVSYTKIAEWEETSQEGFAGTPEEGLEYEHQVEYAAGETIKLMDLEEGIYQIQIQGNEEYEFSTAVVSLPLWNEEAKQMEYEIRLEPKYIRNISEPEPKPEPKSPEETSPKTGDFGKIAIYGFFGIFSLLIVIMSCHNRFKCARMSE